MYLAYEDGLRNVTQDYEAPPEEYYFLSLNSTLPKAQTMDQKLAEKMSLLQLGSKPSHSNLNKCIDILTSVHVVEYADQPCARVCPPCKLNTKRLVCSCKGFRGKGICAHVMAKNHELGAIDLFQMTRLLDPVPRRRGGFNKGVRRALIREYN